MTHVPVEELEAVALGEPCGDRAKEIEAHVAQCPACARESAWLRAEKALLERRPPPQTAHLWPGVAAQLRHPRRRPRWAWRVGVAAGAGAAVAALLLAVLRPRPAPVAQQQQPQELAQRERKRPAIDAKTLAALDRAEADYRDAAKVLEAEYDRLRPSLDPDLARRWDETLTRARAQLGESRAVAADDVNVRMRVLDGYAGYLRSLRDVMQDSEEASP
jgi:anti-sigma factor RsiW